MRSARRVFRMAATSIASSSSAPQTGVRRPKAAATNAQHRQTDADDDALESDPPGTTSDFDAREQTIQTVDEQDHVGGLG